MVNTSLFGLIFFSLFNLQLFGRVPFLRAEVFIEYYEIVLLWFTLIYYFLFQMIFLKKYFILSVLTAFSTFLIIAYYIKGISLDNFIFIVGLCKPCLYISPSVLLMWFVLYYVSAVITKLLGWRRKLTKRTDIYPIYLFCPKEECVRKALIKRQQGKAYPALIAFIAYIGISVVLFYTMPVFEAGFIYKRYETTHYFIPWAIAYLPLLYLVYKGNWKAAAVVYIFWMVDLFEKSLFFYTGYFHFFARGVVMIQAGMLLTIICKVERERLIKSQKE